MRPAIVWFRQDLRLADQPALSAAVSSGRPLICVFILDDATPGPWRRGGASRWWLHHSLSALAASLEGRGARLILRRGSSDAELTALVEESGAEAVYWNRCYEPYAVARDTALKERLTAADVAVHSFNGSLLAEPWAVKTSSGAPFRVFSPFWRALQTVEIPRPLPAPAKLNPCRLKLASDAPDDWALLPLRPDWAGGLREAWTPGEAGALARLDAFIKVIDGYADGRDRPDLEATSRLSAHLHFGEISPRTIYARASFGPRGRSTDKFLAELGWREFSYHLLFHNPALPQTELQEKFRRFPWQNSEVALRAWQRGQTGVPIVDAGMRQLWQTGWMHNRVRMVVASYLVKHLLIDWRKGEDWFWDTLVDADLANNAASWQWVAGCGADAAPYFRVFNPVLQGEKFDADGAYVRHFVPELAALPARFIHKPWEAPALVLKEAGVTIGKTYPAPLIDLAEGRDRALALFRDLKGPEAA